MEPRKVNTNKSVLYDNDIIDSYKQIVKTNSVEKLTEITDFNYYMMGLVSDRKDQYFNILRDRNRIINSFYKFIEK